MDDGPGWLMPLIFVCFVAIPGIMTLLGLKALIKFWRFRRGSVAVTGKVVAVKTINHVGAGHNQPQVTYQPTFEYDAPDGTRLRGIAATYATKQFPINAMQKIHVNFATPDEIHLDQNGALITALAMVLIGGTIVGLSLYVLSGAEGFS